MLTYRISENCERDDIPPKSNSRSSVISTIRALFVLNDFLFNTLHTHINCLMLKAQLEITEDGRDFIADFINAESRTWQHKNGDKRDIVVTAYNGRTSAYVRNVYKPLPREFAFQIISVVARRRNGNCTASWMRTICRILDLNITPPRDIVEDALSSGIITHSRKLAIGQTANEITRTWFVRDW